MTSASHLEEAFEPRPSRQLRAPSALVISRALERFRPPDSADSSALLEHVAPLGTPKGHPQKRNASIRDEWEAYGRWLRINVTPVSRQSAVAVLRKTTFSEIVRDLSNPAHSLSFGAR